MTGHHGKGPVPSSKTKYNKEGFSKREDFLNLNVHSKYAGLLAEASNLALADNSKSQYKTAIKHIARAEEATGTDMSLPFDITKTLNYVGYLLGERNCQSKTVGQYLSAVRMLHLCKGMDTSCLRPPIVSLMLKGREHWDNVKKTLQKKPARVAATLKVMKYLKRRILESDWSEEKKLRIWL